VETIAISALIVVLFLILCSEFVNGWTDAPNAIACLITTRVMSPGQAIALAVVMNVLGTLSGTAVAETIGKGIVSPSTISLLTIAAALVGIIAWGSVAARFGIPTSESHALIAGLSGAAIATAGPGALQWAGWSKVLIGVIAAVVLGLASSWLVSRLIIKLAARSNPVRSRKLFDRLQILAGAFMAYNHGLNDGQKFVGIFTLTLVMGGVLPQFKIPLWVILLCAVTMGIGTSIGGKEIIGTLGEKIARIESWQGFAALTGASSTILAASLLGIPLSTTHTIVAAITGAGMSRSPAVVRWKYPRRIIYASLLTFPLCGFIAFIICVVFQAVQRAFM
jgi:PiT family inorganic phosphate transporter